MRWERFFSSHLGAGAPVALLQAVVVVARRRVRRAVGNVRGDARAVHRGHGVPAAGDGGLGVGGARGSGVRGGEAGEEKEREVDEVHGEVPWFGGSAVRGLNDDEGVACLDVCFNECGVVEECLVKRGRRSVEVRTKD